MSEIREVIADLVADGDEVDALLRDLTPEQWAAPTPAPGWTVKNQLAHLTFIFDLASAAANDPVLFEKITASAAKDFQGSVDAALADYSSNPLDILLSRWRGARAKSASGLLSVPAGQVVPWLVNPLPPAVLAAAGMMELFGHGQDIADALGVQRRYTDRVKHLVEFAVRVRDFGYQARGLTPPDSPFRFELTGPSGAVWSFGPEDAPQRITGPAVDFCLLVTRRRHRDDLAVKADGADAEQWLNIAQAYRGPAGEGRAAGQFASAVS